MRQKSKEWEITKNIIDLEYRKLLYEYSATLIAIISITIGLLTFVYNITRDLLFSLLVIGIVYIVLDSKREEVAKKMNLKINEARILKY